MMTLSRRTMMAGAVGLSGVGLATRAAEACCPAPPISGEPVVNADQTVVILWDKATQTEHFIRRATFSSAAKDFGFLIPSPSKPELSESGNPAFDALMDLTAPEEKTVVREPPKFSGCSCGDKSAAGSAPGRPKGALSASVKVLEEKTVAGFDAAVLETDSAAELVAWLKEHNYAFSPEIEDWSKPYIAQKWKITALRVAKKDAHKSDKQVAADALRLSFKTDRPLFPYREPDPSKAATALDAKKRLLRIYFLGDARYQGDLTPAGWSGKVAWAGELEPAQRTKLLEGLKLPNDAAPEKLWLTEFEDPWPYGLAPSDLYFAESQSQDKVRRPPIIHYVDKEPSKGFVAIGLLVLAALPFARRFTKST